MDIQLTNREKALMTYEALKKRKQRKIQEERAKFIEVEDYTYKRNTRYKTSVYDY